MLACFRLSPDVNARAPKVRCIITDGLPLFYPRSAGQRNCNRIIAVAAPRAHILCVARDIFGSIHMLYFYNVWGGNLRAHFTIVFTPSVPTNLYERLTCGNVLCLCASRAIKHTHEMCRGAHISGIQQRRPRRRRVACYDFIRGRAECANCACAAAILRNLPSP